MSDNKLMMQFMKDMVDCEDDEPVAPSHEAIVTYLKIAAEIIPILRDPVANNIADFVCFSSGDGGASIVLVEGKIVGKVATPRMSFDIAADGKGIELVAVDATANVSRISTRVCYTRNAVTSWLSGETP